MRREERIAGTNIVIVVTGANATTEQLHAEHIRRGTPPRTVSPSGDVPVAYPHHLTSPPLAAPEPIGISPRPSDTFRARRLAPPLFTTREDKRVCVAAA